MLSAVFRGQSLFLLFAVATTLATAGVAYATARRRGAQRPWCAALYAGSIAVVPLLTLWSTGGSGGGPHCVVNRDLLEPFRESTGEGWMNFALFVPTGLSGVLALRRVTVALAAGVLLTCAIETAQGLFPILGRACDTSDVVTNAAGCAAGCAAGALWLLARGRLRRSFTVPRRAFYGLGPAYLAVGVCAFAWVMPDNVAHVGEQLTATGVQRAASERELTSLAGGGHVVTNVTFSQDDTDDGIVMLGFSDYGSLDLAWPSRRHVQLYMDPTVDGVSDGIRVPGVPGPAHDTPAAHRIATAYLRAHAPGTLRDRRPTVTSDVANGLRRRTFTWAVPGTRAVITVDATGRVDDVALDLPAPR